jgi:hypothetical protein
MRIQAKALSFFLPEDFPVYKNLAWRNFHRPRMSIYECEQYEFKNGISGTNPETRKSRNQVKFIS